MAIITDEFRIQSGEFDLELIHGIDLSSRKLFHISPLQECSSLLILDLSCNFISDLQPLSGLQSLEILLLNSNSISTLQPLSQLYRLYSLELSGNKIESSNEFISLGGLFSLKNLVVNELSTGLTNPLCLQPDYFTQVVQILPLLNTLDRIQVSGYTEMGNRYSPLSDDRDLVIVSEGTEISKRIDSFGKEFGLEKDRVDKKLGKCFEEMESRLKLTPN